MARLAAVLVAGAWVLGGCIASPGALKVSAAKPSPLASPLVGAPANPLPVVQPGALLSNDGGGLLSNDGGGLLSNDGGGLLANDGGSLKPKAGGDLRPSSNGGGFSGAPEPEVEEEAPSTTAASILRGSQPGRPQAD